MMSSLSPAERTTLQKQLREAEQAYHELLLGEKARVFVDMSGEKIEYQAVSVDRLRAYIADLRSQLGLAVRVSGPYRPLAGRLW